MENNKENNSQGSPTPVSRPNSVPQRPNLDGQVGVPKPIQKPNMGSGIPKPVGKVTIPKPQPVPVVESVKKVEPVAYEGKAQPVPMPAVEPVVPTPMPMMPPVDSLVPEPTPVPIMPSMEPVEEQMNAPIPELLPTQGDVVVANEVPLSPQEPVISEQKEEVKAKAKSVKKKKKKSSSIVKILGGVLVVGILAGVILTVMPKGNNENTTPPATEQQSKPAKQEPSIPEKEVLDEVDKEQAAAKDEQAPAEDDNKDEYGVTLYELTTNKEIDMRDIRITNLTAKTDTTIEGVELKEGNIFLIMEIAMQNNTDVVVNSGFKAILTDKAGKDTEATVEKVDIYEKEGAYKVTDLKPADATQGVVVLQVPKDFKKVSLGFRGYSVWETDEEVRLVVTQDNL